MHEILAERKFLVFIIIALSVLLIVNIILLDIFVLLAGINKKSVTSQSLISSNNNDSIDNTNVVPTFTTSNSCPSSCLSEIQEVRSSISKDQKIVPTSVPKSSSVSNSAGASAVSEFIIPFGGGTNSTDDWADLSGIAANIDSTKYGEIKTVVFEASVRIPTGNQSAYVRLFNVTDKHPVWFSEVSLEGGTAKLLVSNPITLDQGNKLYQVQMKTSLKFQAILDQSRVRITSY